MLRKKDQGLEWLEFEILADQPKLKHAVFLKHGGVSVGNFASLNLGGGTGDDPEHIAQNREKIKTVLGIKELISGKQVHGTQINLVTSDCSPGECDGIVTQEKGLGLFIKHADCQAAIFYDPIHHAIANVHSGWRGSVNNIYAEAVNFMKGQFGTRPEDLLVGISPSLGPDHSEFKNYLTEIPEKFWKFQVKPTYFDFWEISRFQLKELGILSHHLEMASLCTFCEKEDFFSYRRDKPTGRNGTIVILK
jgi:YfiH family protein